MGASRYMWALPAPSSSARGRLCQGLMRAGPARRSRLRVEVATSARPPFSLSVAHPGFATFFPLRVTAGGTLATEEFIC